MVLLLALSALAAARTNDAGVQFLSANAQKPGVVALPSGLQYKVLEKGSGAYHPTADSACEVSYKGQLIDGKVFDQSDSTEFAPNQVIAGWTEAMQKMVEGDKWEMYIPSDLAYGDGGRPPKIPAKAVLVFTMEIVKIKGDTVPKAEM